MSACVIFNPSARGDKARRFRRLLENFSSQCVLQATLNPGDARRLAAAAVTQGHDPIVAAGGDGTLNEVLNGLADVPDGFRRARLGLLPLGTVNVFARELGIPLNPESAWRIVQQERESALDLPYVETAADGKTRRWYFVQLAGAGLDAAAIARVNWPLKRQFGPLAYVVAGVQALGASLPPITVTAGTQTATGQLVLIGNGRRYGGEFVIFPDADLRDGLLDVCVFPRVNAAQLVQCAPGLLLQRRLPESAVIRLRAASFTLTAPEAVSFEVEGELAGVLPATVSVLPGALRMLIP